MRRVVDPAVEKVDRLVVWHAFDGVDHVDALDADGKLLMTVFSRHEPGECAADVGGSQQLVFSKHPTFTLWARDRAVDA